MKGLPEGAVASKFPAGSSTDSTKTGSNLANLDKKSSSSVKSSKNSLWSSFFAPIFEAYRESSLGAKNKSNLRSHGWTTIVRRAVKSGSMRRLQERLLGFSKLGLSSSTSEKWLLGVCYKISPEESGDGSISGNGSDDFLQDFSSRIWMTYRKGFYPIGDKKFTSDAGWGCMLRSSQMLVAQALLFHYLGRSWRKPAEKPFDPEYIQILHLFGDSELSAFSLHNLVEAGKSYGLAAGSWVGPYAMCRSWETLARAEMEQININEGNSRLPMAVYVISGDEDGDRGGAPVVYIERAAKLCTEFRDCEADWAPLLLLVPLVLGLDKITDSYIPLLGSTFTFPQSLGIMGGRPGASTYIVGVQDDNAFYLDPHEVQQVVDIRMNSTEADTSSYHCSVVRSVSLEAIDPSLAIGFYCRDRGDFEDFCARASELADRSNGAPLFTIAESLILHKDNLSVNCQHGNALDDDADQLGDVGNNPHEDDWQLL